MVVVCVGLGWCGGERWCVSVWPHDATGTITMAAGGKAMMSWHNFYWIGIGCSELARYGDALTPPLGVRNDFYHVPNTPGQGHELNLDYIAAGPDTSLID